MEGLGLVAIALCILVAGGISRRIQGTIVTLPMVYVVLGLLLSDRVLGIVELSPESEIVGSPSCLLAIWWEPRLRLASSVSQIHPFCILLGLPTTCCL